MDIKEITDFLDNLDLSDDTKVRETLIKATSYYSYIVKQYAKVRIAREIKESEEFLKIKGIHDTNKMKIYREEKLTQKDIENMVTIRIKQEIEDQHTLDKIADALQQVMITARKLIDLYIIEKQCSDKR
ncbi:MAG: hypothetical protein ABDH28_01875 [Brevinematia bacterium]